MSEFNIEVQGGSSVRLATAGKYCDRDIIVTASGGGGTEDIEQIIDQSGVLDSTDGTATEKVEQLIDKAEDENLWFERFRLGFSPGGYCNLFERYTGTRLPRTDFSNFTSVYYLFSDAVNLERIDFYINCGKATDGKGAYQRTVRLKYAKGIDTSNMNNIQILFYKSGIEEIEMPLNLSNVTNSKNTNSAFSCDNLKKIRFVAETIKVSITFTSPVLSAESIQSIIDGLAYVETSQNLTLSNKIVLTDNQKATIHTKGWTLIQ